MMDIHALRFRAGEIIGRTFYCSNANMNGLFKIDLETGGLSFVGYFRDNPVNAQNLHFGSLLYKNWIVFVPENAVGIDLYNWKTGEFCCIHFPKEKKYYVNGILCENIAWFIPIDVTNTIFSLNLDTFSVCVYQNPVNCMKNRKMKGKMYRAVYLEGKIYAAIYKTKYVFCFHIDRKTMEFLDTGLEDLCVVDKGRDCLWFLLDHGNEICCWRPDARGKKFLQCPVKVPIRKGERLASFILEIKDSTYIFPGRMLANVLRFDRCSEIFETAFSYPEDLVWHDPDSNYFWSSVFSNGKYYVYPFNANYIIVVNNENEKIEFVKVKQVDTVERGKIFNTYLVSFSDIIMEEQILLKDYLTIFKNNLKNGGESIVDVGSEIYSALIRKED